MKQLNKTATKIMQKLLDLKVSKLDNTNQTFMPVHIDISSWNVKDIIGSGKVITLAHYYEQNGDLMADPIMHFIEAKDFEDNIVYIPYYYGQDGLGISQYSLRIEHDKITGINLKLQREHADFANQWLKNIKMQQEL